jgi:sigma-54 dependent transcriptional regulator, acetoin dehydrogenase operon transcriptional activator AcoR
MARFGGRCQWQTRSWNEAFAHGSVFFATGDVEAADVCDEILRSWKRCHEAGLDPLGPAVPLKQNRDEFSETLKRNGAYIEAASPFMRFLGSAVRGTGFILALTDAAGIVLESFGDEDVICLARENNFVPGSCRAEEAVGTCSIGLAIIEGKPIQLTGPEHYSLRHHVWTCASAPVFSPAGIFLGTATLSGVCSKAHPHTLGMVISAAALFKTGCESDASKVRSRKANASAYLF